MWGVNSMFKKFLALFVMYVSCIWAVDLSIDNVDLDSGTLDIVMNNDEPVAGFQVDLSGIVIINASGGSAESNGFLVSTSASTIIGFSLTGATIPAGNSVLANISFSNFDTEICIVDPVVSNPSGNALEVSAGDCFSQGGSATIEINLSSDTPIAGFQFDIEGVSILSASGGSAESNGFLVSTSASTVLGFSLTGSTIPAGEGVLEKIKYSNKDTEACMTEIIFSSFSGEKLSNSILNCLKPIDDIAVHKFKSKEEKYREKLKTHKKILKDGKNIWVKKDYLQQIPNKFSLSQISDDSEVIALDLNIPKSGNISIQIYNIAGQLVATLMDEYKDAGKYKVLWNDVRMAKGLYFFKGSYLKQHISKTIIAKVADHNKKNILEVIQLSKLHTNNYQKPKYPALLIIESIKFTEPSGNKSLDGLETGKIVLGISNKGKGYASKIEIDVTPLSSSKNLVYESKIKIDRLDSKSTETIEIPITADINAQSMERKFRIEVTEHFGFDSDPATISFTTTAFMPPDLQINQTAIDDDDEGDSMGNDNSTIEPGESIEVTAFVQNFGDGDVEDVKAEVLFNTTNRNISYPDEGQIYSLGDIASGDYKEFKFYFFTSRRYDEVELPISVKLTESKGEFGKTIDLGLKAGERTQNIVDVQITRVEKAKRDKTIRQIEGIITLADVDENIPNTKTNGKNTLVVIIGVEDYKYAPDVDYAGRDAQYFYEYSKSVLGAPEPNIYFRVDDGATSGEFNKIFAEDGWIARRLGSKTDIVFYYSGHGAPDPKSEKGYLIPHDIDPNYPSTGFSIDQIYQSLADLNANSVTVFIDACFSGESRSEEMLVEGIRPISIEITNPVLLAENFSVFSASEGKQYSAAYPEKFHGLFTYFLLKGLQGSARGDDKDLTIGELYDYVRENVSSQAGYLDKEQDPTFIGTNKDKVLVRY